LVVVLLGQTLGPHGKGQYSFDWEGVLVLQVGEYVAVLKQYFYRYAP
jgi:hypothetical protein